MSKFKKGDRVFDLRYGVGRVGYLNADGEPMVNFRTQSSHVRYFTNGCQGNFELSPILWTLDEAKAKGYDVPKEEKTLEYSEARYLGVTCRFRNEEGFFKKILFEVPDRERTIEGVVGELTFKYEE